MPIPANRAKIQLARGNYSNLIANVAEFGEGELSYAKDENLLYIKEEGELIRLEYVTRADLDAAVEDSIDLEVYGGDGLLTVNGGGGSSPTTTLSIDEDWLREKTGITDSKEPAGFVDKTLTVIAHRPVENKVWLYPTGTSAAVWCQGVKHTFETYKEVAQPTVSGLHYIYLNSSFALQSKSTQFDYKNETPVCQIYWNQSSGEPVLLLDRRHGISMSWATQEFLDAGLSPIVKSGFAISGIASNPDGSSDNHAKFSLTGGTSLFQDVKIEVTHSPTPAGNVASNLFQQVLEPAARLPVLYLNNANWEKTIPTDYAFATTGGVPTYNVYDGSWSLEEVTDENYFVSYIVLTGNTEYPVLAIAGQEQFSTLSDAEGTAFEDIDLADLKDIQLRLLYKIIYKYSTSYTNTSNVLIAGFEDLRYVGKAGSGAISDHGRLNGLEDDDHIQYVHISLDRTISANHTHSGTINITNATESTTAVTGALKVAGGVGISGNLNVTGDIGATIDGGNF